MDEDNFKLSKYNSVKNELDVIYDRIREGIRIRSKCDWYEHSEKLTFFFFFLNLEKQQGSKITIKKLLVKDKEITDQTQILEHIREFYEHFSNHGNKKLRLKWQKILVMLTFQNSPKIKQNFVTKI